MLEDYAESMCDVVEPTDPRTERRQITSRITDALRLLRTWPVSEARDRGVAWLENARSAIDRRNAILHAVPLVDVRDPTVQYLGQMPRKGAGYMEHPLTPEHLASLTGVLQGARRNWRDVYSGLYDAREVRGQ